MICTLNAKNRVGWEIFHLIKQKLRSGYPAACWQPKQPNQDGSLEFWGSVYSLLTSFLLGLRPNRALPCAVLVSNSHTDHIHAGRLVQGIPTLKKAMPRHKSLALLTRISNGLTRSQKIAKK